MKFLAILVGVIIELYALQVQKWRRFAWFARWTDLILPYLRRLRGGDGRVGVLIIIMPLVLMVFLLDWKLTVMIRENLWLSIVGFVFYATILIYCMGPKDPIRIVDEYMNSLERNDFRAAQTQVEQLLGHVVTEPVEEYAQHMRDALLVRVNDNIIGVIFWFVLIGPVGALLFRLSCELKERFAQDTSGLARASVELYHIVSWLPARIGAISYAFAGSFVDTIANWKHISDLWMVDGERLLVQSGLGSVGEVQHEDEEQSGLQSLSNVLAMVKRSVLILIVLLAFTIIIGLFHG